MVPKSERKLEQIYIVVELIHIYKYIVEKRVT